MDTIYNLRHTQLDTHLMYQLHQIIYAYRPHDSIPKKEDLPPRVTQTQIRLKDLSNMEDL